jgi:hypothetical protein
LYVGVFFFNVFKFAGNGFRITSATVKQNHNQTKQQTDKIVVAPIIRGLYLL